MQTNNHQIVDYDLVLDQKFGKGGTPERIKAEEDALSFYSGQILLDARKEGATDKPCGKEVRMRPYCWRYKYHSFPWTD